MRELTIDEIKIIQLNILKSVHTFCSMRKIKYFLAYGTLLGAVRHEGYIPWDDDIDICMMREDYDRFIHEFRSDTYKIYATETVSDCVFPYAKIYDKDTKIKELTNLPIDDLGINIDLFPVEKIPKDEKKINRLFMKIKFLKILLGLKSITVSNSRSWYKNLILIIGYIVLKPISYLYIVKRIQTAAQSYNNNLACELCGQLVLSVYGKNELVPKDVFDKTITLNFEGYNFSCPFYYDILLRSLYGDYMKLPPIDEQVTHHSFCAYLLEP